MTETQMSGDLAPDLERKRAEVWARVRGVVADIEYRPETYKIKVGLTEGMKYPYVQVTCWRPDTNTGEMGWGGGGKAYVSEWATESEIYQMVLGLAMAYETHEVREAFKVKGKRIYGPHIDSAALAEVCDRLDARPSSAP